MAVAERLPNYRSDPALRRSLDIYMSKAREVFTTDKDGSREQIAWIVSNARKDLHENGPVRHVEGKRRGYFGDSATLADQAACSYRDKRDADRIADAKKPAHEQWNQPLPWEGESRNKLVPDDEIDDSESGQPLYGSKKTHPPRDPWRSR